MSDLEQLPLLVPVELEALVVNAADRRATTWSVSSRTFAGADRLLPVEPPPFARDNDRPREGVTLHWLLPDALTVGRWHDGQDGDPELRYPFLPDRWLVVRTASVDGAEQRRVRAWVVESSYLGDGGANPVPQAGGGLARLGRATELGGWEAPSGTPAVALTAVGPVFLGADGTRHADVDPGYAASAANVDNVFSFHDALDDLGADDPAATLSYTVVGWYADPGAADPMVDQTRLGRELARRSTATPTLEEWSTLVQALGWSVGDSLDLGRAQLSATGDPEVAGTAVPRRTLCHGTVHGVRWLGFGGPAQPFTAGSGSAFAGSAITSRTGWRDQESVTTQAALRRPGGGETLGERSRYPYAAVGTSTGDAVAALFEFLLGREEGSPAPSDLAGLVQALEHDLLDLYDKPGGAAEIARRAHQQGFLAHPGGTLWEVVLRGPDAPSAQPGRRTATTSAPEGVDLLRALDGHSPSLGLASGLDDLNRACAARDRSERLLRALRRELYAVWWKVGRGADDRPRLDQLATQVEEQRALVTTAAAEVGQARDALLTQLGSGPVLTALAEVLAEPADNARLELVETPSARFFAPADPVVVISGGRASSKHGGDGRHSDDGTLLVRFGSAAPGAPGQTLRHQDDVVNVVVERLVAELPLADKVPAAAVDLLIESLLLDPGAGTPASDLGALWAHPAGQLHSVAAVTLAAHFVGVRPSPVGVESWSQPWRPLYLAWRATWYPTSRGPATDLGEWIFDGEDYQWLGASDFDHARARTIQGRSLVATTSTKDLTDAVEALHERIAGARVDRREVSEQQREEALLRLRASLDRARERLGSADLLAQAMTGFHDQLVQRDRSQFIEPREESVSALLGGRGEQATGGLGLAAERAAPVPYGDSSTRRFFPVRAGHARLRKLWLVDGFGQVFDVIHEQGLTDASFTPLRGRGLATVGVTQRSDAQMLQLAPRLVQPSRLAFRFDSSRPVAGWLLPNHLDASLMVYDSDGRARGAVLLWGAGAALRWEPPPGEASDTTPADLADPRLRQVVEALLSQGVPAFGDFRSAVDRTLWTTEPGGDRGTGLSVLVGRPIAVIGVQLSVELDGPPLVDQLTEYTSRPIDDGERTAGVTALRVPVRLGLPESREDGTLGWFAPGESAFHSVLPQLDTSSDFVVVSARSGWPQAPVRGFGDDTAATVTLLADPRGSVTATTGLQPSKTLRLPRRLVEGPLSRMDAAFRVGPLLSGRSVRMPLPSDIAQGWSWVEKTGVVLDDGVRSSETWSEPVEVEATAATAHLSNPPSRIREGWLRLSQVAPPTTPHGE